ncbi:hypothetical protein NW768_002146 [Fusarium equiseti]|uniref:DUF6604 domain-containing protein n=1 Tax=Fusarium equiseti TaxID=61235 RepID=A0ABQ8RMM7_FUSEQ|nr:hypothetical protein NW768_002146 [Fusarium equiseti]
MLSPAYMSIYQQYKADTDSVATWLAITAKANGFDEQNAAAKKAQAEEKEKERQRKGKRSCEGKYIIKVRDFEDMAKFVVDTNAIEVPHRTAVALERVIWVRRSFSKQVGGRDRRSDATHAHFINVLEKVRDHLKPIMEAGLFKPTDTPKEGKARRPLSNMFDCLNVYTPSETFLNAPDITPEPSVQYTVEQEPTLEDATFALLALLGDLENIQDEISELWKKYAAGKIDLAAAAVATNTAFELAQSLENEVKDLLDKFMGITLLMESLFQSACEMMGIDVGKKARGDAFNIRGYPLAKDMHINTLTLLKSYVDQSREVYINIYNDMFGWYDEELGAKGKTNSEKWAQDRGAMMALLPDLQFLGTRGGRGQVEDEIVRATGEVFDSPNKRLSVWLPWALNVWLDILQGFGSNCGQAYEELRQESLKIQKALLNLPDTPQRTDVLETVTRWNRDPTYIARTDLIKTGTLGDDDIPPEFTFLRRHPIFCGLLLHHYRCQLHEKGVELAAHSGGLMCTTQLYQALRNENRLPDKKWDDLETFWEYQGDPCFFVGGPPKDREGYHKNFGICTGLSASNWAPNKRSDKPVVHKKNLRNMKFDGWLSLKVGRRLHVDNRREPWTEAYVTELLVDGRTKEMQDGKGKTYANMKGKEKEACFTIFYDRILTNVIQHEPLPSTPKEIISHLAQVVDKQVLRIAFNYFNMHYISKDLLTSLKDAFTKAIGPEFMTAVPNEDQLPLVVGYVFSTAAGHSSEDVRVRRAGNDGLINIATEIVNDFLDSGMGSWITKASQQDVNPEEVEGLDIDGSKNWAGNAIGNIMREGSGAFEGRDKPTAGDLEKLMGMLGLNRAEMNDLVRRSGF